MAVYQSVDELIGNTPLLALHRLEKKLALNARLFAKPEYLNPAGSVKDRVARAMLDEAEASGKLTKDSVIIEPTSGNTGIGLCALGAARGYRTIIVMPDTMSRERQLLMTAYGAELRLSPGKEGMKGAIALANKLAAEIENSFIPGQFENPANPKAHYDTTGPEIFADTAGEVDLFVAGVGTGGTISGIGRFLKEQKPAVRIIGVEPATSAVISGKPAGPHGLQGIGAGFLPEVLDLSVLDEIMTATTEQAMEASRLLAKTEGFLVGISSGAALHAAIEQAKREENKGKTIVVLLPDGGERYLSTDLFSE